MFYLDLFQRKVFGFRVSWKCDPINYVGEHTQHWFYQILWFDFNWTRMQKHWERIKVNQGNKSCSLKSRIFLTILSSSLLNSNVYKPVVIWWYKTNLSINNIVCFVLGETFGGEWFLFSLKFYFYFKFKYLNKQQQQKVKRLWFL